MPEIEFEHKARDSKDVSVYSLGVLQDVLKAAAVRKIMITSVARSPLAQAAAMYTNIEAKGVAQQKSLYGPAGDKVIDEYARLKKAGKSREEIIAGMSQKITEIGPRKVSNHAADPAKLNVIDIAPSSMSSSERTNFIKAVGSEKRISKFLQPPKDPAYHVEIPQPAKPAS